MTRLAVLLPLLLLLCCSCPAAGSANPFTSQALTILPAGANVSSPTNINIATSFPLSGAYSDRGPQTSQAFFLWLQRVNERGGVLLNGTRFNFTLSYTDDCSSPGYVQTIFSNFVSALNSEGQPLYQVVHTPTTSTLSVPAVQAIALSTSQPPPTFTTYAASPALYSGAYPFVYGNIALSSLYLNKTLSTVLDFMPLRTVAVYYRLDAFTSTLYPVVLQWAEQRGLALVSNVALDFPASGVQGPAMARLISANLNGSAPPDLFVMCVTSYTDAESACQAFQLLQFAPASALYVSAFADSSFFAQCDQWVSVNQWGPGLNFSSSIPDFVFAFTYELQALVQEAYNINLSSFHVQTAADLDLMLAALTLAQSTQPALVHAAMLQLTGDSIVGAFRLDPVKQNNALAQNYPYQLRGGVNALLASPDELVYPARWAWVQVLPGDALSLDWTASLIVLAVVLCVFGAWISVILLEQTLVLLAQRRRRWYWLWLGLSSTALGGGAIWTCATILFASLSIDCPACVADVSIAYSLPVVFLALLPALGLPFVSLLIMTARVRFRNAAGVKDDADRSSATEHDSAKQALAALRVAEQAGLTSSIRTSGRRRSVQPSSTGSQTEGQQQQRAGAASRLSRLPVLGRQLRVLAHNSHLLLAAAFLAAAIIATRAVLVLVFVTNADFSASGGAQAVSVVIAYALSLCTLYAVFFARTLRLLGVCSLTLGVVLDFVYQSSQLTARYQPGYAPEPGSLYAGAAVSSAVLTLVMAILGAVLGIALIALQFKKMALSHHSNMLSLLKLRRELQAAKRDTALQLKQTAVMAQLAAELARVLEAINVSRPDTDSAKQLAMIACLVSAPSPFDSQLAASAQDLAPLLRKADAAADSLAASVEPSSFAAQAESSTPISWMGSGSRGSLDGNGNARPQGLTVSGSKLRSSVWGGNSAAVSLAAQSLFSATTGCSESRREQEEALEAMMEQLERAASSSRARGGAEVIAATAHRNSLTDDVNSLSPASVSAVGSPTAAGWDEGALLTVVKAASERALNVADFRPTLLQLLSHPLTVELLKDELLRHHCAENLLFLLAVRRFERVAHCRPLQRRLARYVVDEFVREGARQEVNLNQKLRSAVISAFERGGYSGKTSKELFAAAKREVLMLLETNSMKPFQSSQAYATAAFVLARNALVVTRLRDALTPAAHDAELEEREAAGEAENATEQSVLSSAQLDDSVLQASAVRRKLSSHNELSSQQQQLDAVSAAAAAAAAATNLVSPVEAETEVEPVQH